MSSNPQPAPAGTPITSAIHPTSQRQLDEAVARLREAAPAFARLSIPERIALARSMQAGYLRIAEQSVRPACAAKGIPSVRPPKARSGRPVHGAWCAISGWSRESLTSLQRTGTTPIGRVRPHGGRPARGAGLPREHDRRRAVRRHHGGRAHAGRHRRGGAARVPRRLLPGPVARRTDGAGARRRESRRHSRDGRHHQAVQRGEGLPAQDEPGQRLSRPVHRGGVRRRDPAGFLAVVYGGAEEGAYLAQHPASTRSISPAPTGPTTTSCGGRRARSGTRARRATPRCSPSRSPRSSGTSRRCSSCPARTADRELAFQAESIAGAVAHNASFNCNTPKMLVTPRGWAGATGLLAAIERALAADAGAPGVLPGRRGAMAGDSPGAARDQDCGRRRGPGELPWTLLPGLDATDPREPAFTTEPFCSILSETEVGSDDPVEFLERAVDFANNRLWGTLSAELVVHPRR